MLPISTVYGTMLQTMSVIDCLKGPKPSDFVFVFLLTMQIKSLCPLELILTVKAQGLHVFLVNFSNVFTYHVIPC